MFVLNPFNKFFFSLEIFGRSSLFLWILKLYILKFGLRIDSFQFSRKLIELLKFLIFNFNILMFNSILAVESSRNLKHKFLIDWSSQLIWFIYILITLHSWSSSSQQVLTMFYRCLMSPLTSWWSMYSECLYIVKGQLINQN